MFSYIYIYATSACLPWQLTKPGVAGAAAIGAAGALMNRVRQPRPLIVLGLNVWTLDPRVLPRGLLDQGSGLSLSHDHTSVAGGSNLTPAGPRALQGDLVRKELPPPPKDHHRTLGIVLL